MFKNVYRGKRVLITGNTGFKGTWLSIWLLKLGAKVYGVSNDIPTKPSIYYHLKLSEKIYHYDEDVRNLEKLSKIIKEIKPHFIFHLAAQSLVSLSYSDPIKTLSTNVIGTANLCEILRNSTFPCNAVIITSDKCYDNVEWVWGYKEDDRLGGKDIYSGSKGAAELIFKSYFHSFFKMNKTNIKIASARAGNVIGGGDWAKDRIVPDAMRAWSDGKYVEIRSPNSTRPWQHVLEPLSGYLSLGEKISSNPNINGESYNFGPKATYNQTVEKIIIDLSKLWKFKKSFRTYKIVQNADFKEANLLKLNCDKALFDLKWVPTLTYNYLIDFTSSWYFEFYNKNTSMLDYTLMQISDYENIGKEISNDWAK